jgi:hypothetical protein
VRSGLVLVLLAGCVTSRQVKIAGDPAAREELQGQLRDQAVTLGIAKREGATVYAYDVTAVAARDLQLGPRRVAWTDAASGAPASAPLEVLRWIRWLSPGHPRWLGFLQGAGFGALGGAALGWIPAVALGDGAQACVGGTVSPTVGGFALVCHPIFPETSKALFGVAAGVVIGALVGGIIGAILGDREELAGFGDAPPQGTPP